MPYSIGHFFSYARSLTDANRDVSLTSERTLVVGGTQGIGAGIALRFAMAGSDVWIVGRSEERAKAVLRELESASQEAARRRAAAAPQGSPVKDNAATSKSDHRFFWADLSRKDEICRVAEEVARRAGEKGIDVLVETQGGPPTGVYKPPTTPTDHEAQFTVQVLSRFGIAHILASTGTIRRGICLVGAPGGGKLDEDDLDFSKAKADGTWKDGLRNVVTMGKRDSAALDCAVTVLAERHPNLTISHLFPGIVSTQAFVNQGFPAPLQFLATTFGPYVADGSGPGAYAELPFHLHAHPLGARYLRAGEPNLLGPRLGRIEPSAQAKDKSTRERVVATLEEWLR